MYKKIRFLFILLPLAFIAAAGFAAMGLWNWIMPSLFGFGTLTFFKALGLLLLARLIFGGRGGGMGRRWMFSGKGFGPNWGWKQNMYEKWQNMSAEEKAAFRGRCGRWSGHDRAQNSDAEMHGNPA